MFVLISLTWEEKNCNPTDNIFIAQFEQYNNFQYFFLAACFSALRSILVVDLMGLEKLTNAFGILCLFQGMAAAIGAPIAGMIYNCDHAELRKPNIFYHLQASLPT